MKGARFPGIDRSQYEADGVSIARGILPPPVVHDLRKGSQALRDHLAAGEMVRKGRFVWGCLPELLSSVSRNKTLVRAARALLRTNNIALYMHRVLVKDEDWSGAVNLHQDMPYFSGGLHKMSAFVPLAPTSATNGGLIFVKGSHRYGNLPRGTVRREAFPPMEELAPDLDVGDVVLMDFLTWHYSNEATIPTERLVMQIVYQPATDGGYAGFTLGVPEPTLVSGRWMTSYFVPKDEATVPDN